MEGSLRLDGTDVVDELVKEYLLFRGFTQTFKAFEMEKKNDRSLNFNVERIVESLFDCVYRFNADDLHSLWNSLEEQFFSKLPVEMAQSCEDLRLSLWRLFVVAAVQQQQYEKLDEFFKKYGNLEMQKNSVEFLRWLKLYHLRNPELVPELQPYFHKTWVEALSLSLRNFLTTVFRFYPKPRFFNFQRIRKEFQTMSARIRSLEVECANLRRGIGGEISPAGSPVASRTTTPVPDSVGDASDPALVTPITSRLGYGAGADAQSSQKRKGGLRGLFSKKPASELSSARPKRSRSLICFSSSIARNGVFDLEFDQEPGRITVLSFSETGNFLAVGDSLGNLWVFCTMAGEMENTIVMQYNMGAGSEICSISWDTLQDTLLLVVTSDGKAAVYNVPMRKRQAFEKKIGGELGGKILASAIAPKNVLCVISSDKSFGLFNLRTLKRVKTLGMEPFYSPCTSLIFNHNGTLLVVGCDDGMVRIYDMHTQSAFMGWNADYHGSMFLNKSETSLFVLGKGNQVKEWSIHVMGKQLNETSLPEYTLDVADSVCLIAPVASESHVISSHPLGLTFVKQDSPLFSPIRILNASGDEAVEHFSVSALASHPVMDRFVVGTLDGTVRFVHLDLEQSDGISQPGDDSIILHSRGNADEDTDSEEDEEERLSRMRRMDEDEEAEYEEGTDDDEADGNDDDGVDDAVNDVVVDDDAEGVGESEDGMEKDEELRASMSTANDESKRVKGHVISKGIVDDSSEDI
eukprot:TRINITY_DN4379_c0_g1_i1.p1 TRINITY_DN4379_c0_g1~~TRINITY_DN4379_c0_g1_i1.p1  ORF type:complete len:748 (-),score=209.85 TRINITY_DN4379_c0_g1_i1:50-2293(-)